MRAIRAKQIKYNVLAALYGENVTDSQREIILADPKFKKVYRRAKKNYQINKAKK